MLDTRSTYQETLDWLYQQLPMYQRDGAKAYKADLKKTWALVHYLDHPHEQIKTIHVAGTNGKGSTSHMLASILQEAGYRVGLYTSPHLKDFRERIRINGQKIPKEVVVDFVRAHQSFFSAQHLSFFEMTVGLAFRYFADQKVDIAVIEVGMGGRLDSTNVISPELSVITNIGLDHMAFLGTTLSAIAQEKAGIIKPGVGVVVGEVVPETRQVFDQTAQLNNAPLIYSEAHYRAPYPMDLKGAYQKANQQTVRTAIAQLIHKNWVVHEDHIKLGLLHVVANTKLLGRWQQLAESPKIICDTAHNVHGLTQTMRQIKAQHYKSLHMVIGFVNDKDIKQALALMPFDATYYFCAPNLPRGLAAAELANIAGQMGLVGKVYPSVANALNSAKALASQQDFIYVGGSTFVVAEVL
jgi:dihydrofolate synthase / folylpolyglutamate synthase